MGTIVRLDSNETLGEKAIYELHKNSTCCFEKSWKQYPIKLLLYSHLPPISQTIKVRRTRHVGHCWRNKNELGRVPMCWNYHFSQNKISSLGAELSTQTPLFYNGQLSVPNFLLTVFGGRVFCSYKTNTVIQWNICLFPFWVFCFSSARTWNLLQTSTLPKVHLSLPFVMS